MAYMYGQPGQARPGQARSAQYAQANVGYAQVQRGAGGYTQVRDQASMAAPTVRTAALSSVLRPKVLGGGFAALGGMTATRAAVDGGVPQAYTSTQASNQAQYLQRNQAQVATQPGNRHIVSPVSAAPSARMEILPGAGALIHSGAYAPLTETAAPYLRKYHEQMVNLLQSTDLGALSLALVAGDTQGHDDMKQSLKTWYEATGKGLVVQSFWRHDLNQDGVLDANEAQAFFQHLIDEHSLFVTALAAQGVQQTICAVAKMMTPMLSPEENQKRNSQSQISAGIAQGVAAAKNDSESRVQNYLSRKKFYDAAAFDFIDAKQDGTIHLEELLAVLDPSSDLNDRLMVVMGFTSEAEYLFSKQLEGMTQQTATGEAPQCQQM